MLRIQSYEVDRVRKTHSDQFCVESATRLVVGEGVGSITDPSKGIFEPEAGLAARTFCWSINTYAQTTQKLNQHVMDGIFRLAHYDMQALHHETNRPARVVGAAALTSELHAIHYGYIGDAGIVKLDRTDGRITFITEDDMQAIRTDDVRTVDLHDRRITHRSDYAFMDGAAQTSPVVSMGVITTTPQEKLAVFTGAFRQLLQDETARRLFVQQPDELDEYIAKERNNGRFMDEMSVVAA